MASVLVIGATSGTGELIVEQLLKTDWTITIMARNTAKAQKRFGSQNIDIIYGDMTKPETFPTDFENYTAIILTVAVGKRPVRESFVKATEYDGTRNLLDVAKRGGFTGRFMYMNTIGTVKPSFITRALNLFKGKSILWRHRVELLIRDAGVDYTIIRAALLNDKPAGTRAISITQGDLPLTFSDWISRADIATLFIEALEHDLALNTTCNAKWELNKSVQPVELSQLLAELQPDHS